MRDPALRADLALLRGAGLIGAKGPTGPAPPRMMMKKEEEEW